MSVVALLLNDGAAWKDLYVHSITYNSGGVLKPQHAVCFSVAAGVVTIQYQTGGITVTRSAAGLFSVNYSAKNLSVAPYVTFQVVNPTMLVANSASVATTTACDVHVATAAGVDTDPVRCTVVIMEQ